MMRSKLCTPQSFWLKIVVRQLCRLASSSPAQGPPVQGYTICLHKTMDFAIELSLLSIVSIIHVAAAIRSRVLLCVQWEERLLTIQWLTPIHCSVCDRWLNGRQDWDNHLLTTKHIQRIRRLQRKKRAQEAFEEMQQEIQRSEAKRPRSEE